MGSKHLHAVQYVVLTVSQRPLQQSPPSYSQPGVLFSSSQNPSAFQLGTAQPFGLAVVLLGPAVVVGAAVEGLGPAVVVGAAVVGAAVVGAAVVVAESPVGKI